MQQDAQGNAISTAGADSARAFDHTIAGYLGYRFDTAQRMQALLAADPDCGMAHALKAAFLLLGYKQAFVPMAKEAIATAGRLTARATPREQAHVAALGAWADGEMDRALSAWEGILRRPPARHPRLPPAPFLRLLARPAGGRCWPRSRACCRAGAPGCPAMPASSPAAASPMRSAATTSIAEDAGRAAIALDPGDLWAAHAVAHVLEMQGRRSEGIAWIDGLEPNWDGGNNLMHHLWWHQALIHLERGDFDASCRCTTPASATWPRR